MGHAGPLPLRATASSQCAPGEAQAGCVEPPRPPHPCSMPLVTTGISEWMTPRPAVIHCTPPSVMTPEGGGGVSDN